MTWPRDAYVGQKIVAIKEGKAALLNCDPILIIGRVYTIAEIIPFRDNIIGIQVKENYVKNKYGFNAICFRPVQDTIVGMELIHKAKDPNFKIEEDKFDKILEKA